MSTDLFGNPSIPPGKPKPQKGAKGDQCRDCKHCFEHEYRSDWVYCNQQYDAKTLSKRKKIKKTDAKCWKFEAR